MLRPAWARSKPKVSKSLTTAEAAAVLGIKPVTVRAHIAHGRLVATKQGRDYLIAPGELERFKREKRPYVKKGQDHELPG